MTNKHLPHDLKQMQSLPLESKIIMSTRRVREWFEYWDGEVYVSFSGGKDSTVLADLVARFCQRYGYTLHLLFVNTGLEYPEIQKFVKDFAEWLRITYGINVQLDIVRPDMRFDQVIKTYGYPVISKAVADTIHFAKKNIAEGKDTLRVRQLMGVEKNHEGSKSKFNKEKWRFLLDAPFDAHSECCYIMKKKPVYKYEQQTGRKPIIGTLATESEQRKAVWEKHGCNAFGKKHPSSQPLSFWTEQDVLHYIKTYIQKRLDTEWKKVNSPYRTIRKNARKYVRSLNYMKLAYASVYGDIQVKPPADAEEGQMNIIDFLGCYDKEDILETTGCDRTGCIFCMFGCHLEKEPNRFQRLKETHPRQYEYCIGGGEMVDGKWQPNKEGLGLGKVLDYIGVKYD